VAAAAEARKKWDGRRASSGRSLEWEVAPSLLMGCHPRIFCFENIGANICNLVHLGVKYVFVGSTGVTPGKVLKIYRCKVLQFGAI